MIRSTFFTVRSVLSFVLLAGLVMAGLSVLLDWMMVSADRYPDARSTRLARHLEQTLKSVNDPESIDLIIWIDGASWSTRGVDGALIERRLRANGVDALVFQNTIPGGNHIERDYVARLFLSRNEARFRGLIEDRRMIFLEEANFVYNRDPLTRQFEQNKWTPDVIAYMDSDSVGALNGIGGLGAGRATLVLRHFLIRATRTGGRAWHQDWSDQPVTAGHQPLAPSGGVDPGRLEGVNPSPQPGPDEISSLPLMRWKQARFEAIGRGSTHSTISFMVPTLHQSSYGYFSDYCDADGRTCLSPDWDAVIPDLAAERFWYNQAHLSGHGAQRYTLALTRSLLAYIAETERDES